MFQVRTALARMKLRMEQESSKSQLASLEERLNVAEQRWDHSKAGSMEEGELATSWGKSEIKPEKARDLLQIFFPVIQVTMQIGAMRQSLKPPHQSRPMARCRRSCAHGGLGAHNVRIDCFGNVVMVSPFEMTSYPALKEAT